MINKHTMLVLVNAIYMNARWAHEFERNATSDERFTLADGTHVKVPTMHQDETLPAVVHQGLHGGRAAVRGNKLAMLIVMPTAGTFARFERSLDPAVLADVIDRLDTR